MFDELPPIANSKTGIYFDETIEMIRKAQTFSQIQILTDLIWSRLGLEQYFYYLPGQTHTAEEDTLIHNYPSDWLNRYVQKSYVDIDPVVILGSQFLRPIDWQNLPKREKKIITLFGEAVDFGVAPRGLTFKISGPGLRFALFTLTARFNANDWELFRRFEFPNVVYFANLLHQRVVDIKFVNLSLGRRPVLTPRERQCLAMVARGYRQTQIAQDQGITVKVVNKYLESVRHKFGTDSTTEAALLAIEQGIIIF